MTKREIKQLIKLTKDRITMAQLFKNEFINELGIKGFENYINAELEQLKSLIEQLKKLK